MGFATAGIALPALDRDRGPTARRHAVGPLEMARHVTLVRKSARGRRIGNPRAAPSLAASRMARGAT